MSNPSHVLVVDDDPGIRDLLRRYLTSEGFRISEAGDGTEMRKLLERESVDLVLLDLMMPGEDGLSLARHIRQRWQMPIIMLTGKVDVIDRIVGLEAGADDYVAKPFHLREVLARIRTVMRRLPAGGPVPSTAPHEPSGIFSFEGWRLDTVKRELLRPGGEVVVLTSGEFELLLVLVRHPNRVLSRDQLMDLVKGRDWAANDRTMDTQIGRLRQKIEVDPGNPDLIKTVRGAGYIFAATVTGA
jgi:two-component system, OmpR family, response regulator